MREHVNVFFVDMSVNECVTPNEDGSFSVFINSRLCDAKKEKALRHALKHIQNDDFYSEDDADAIERKART